jgi:hypothetical protein
MFHGGNTGKCGAAVAAQVLNDEAEVLESLVTQTLDLMNKGHSLDEIPS